MARSRKSCGRAPPETSIHGFEFGDVDGDGDLDVIAADYADGGSVSLFLNNEGRLAARACLVSED